jgi:deoxyribose-phosphate aldolase
MAPTPTTDAEWASAISNFEQSLTVAESKKYPASTPGSAEFNKTIDHTLLKLDATAEQFEKLLEEAKQEKFAVCSYTHEEER